MLVKGGAFIEAPARVRAGAFDKPGKLMQGRPSLVEVVPLSDHDTARARRHVQPDAGAGGRRIVTGFIRLGNSHLDDAKLELRVGHWSKLEC